MTRVKVIALRVSVFELAYRYVYPSLKKRLVEILYRNYGLSQWRIAKLLSIDQSTVYRYLSGERGVYIDFSTISFVEQNLQRIAVKVVSGELQGLDLESELVKLTLNAMSQGYICRYHKLLDKSIRLSECRVCFRVFGESAKP